MSISLALACVALCAVLLLRKVGNREDGLPPGPPTIPLLGNLHMFPSEFAYHKLTAWARKYGGIYSLKLGPGTIIVLSDPAAVKELLGRRGANTADRPSMQVEELVTGGLNMVLAHYGECWRTFRRTAHAILTPQAVAQHLSIQRAEATHLLHDILGRPESFYTHIQRFTYSVIVSVLYGKRAPRYEAPETVAFFDYECQYERLLEPGAAPPVDMFPILKLVPERWAKWKRNCRRIRNLQRAVYFGLLDETVGRMRSGSANGSYMEEVLERQEEFGMDREMIGYLGGVLVEAGAATTYSYLHTLVLCLVAYPDAQKKAHEEIDCVVGEHRMPTLDDLEQMPFIRGLILEVHRFRPVVPLLVPREALAPVEYKGYTIPKGATIFVNAWIFHDPALYDDPENFVPDRYLMNENGTKPGIICPDLEPDFIFGLGRRSCPGIHLAHNSININVTYLLWAFNFNTDIDAAGDPIKLDTSAYSNGVATGPRPFKCRITPRSAEKAEIIRREFLEAADTFSKFEFGLSAEDKEYVAKSRAHTG